MVAALGPRVSRRTVFRELKDLDARTEAELRELLETADPVLVDPRARDLYAQGHRDGAVNIPERELQSRAAIELPHSRPVVVDCRRGSESMCDVAARVLQRVGFPEVSVFVPD